MVGRLMDQREPAFVIEVGVVMAAGLLGATYIASPGSSIHLGRWWRGANRMSFSVQSQYHLPNQFCASARHGDRAGFLRVGRRRSCCCRGWCGDPARRLAGRVLDVGVMTLGRAHSAQLIVHQATAGSGLLPDGGSPGRGPAARND